MDLNTASQRVLDRLAEMAAQTGTPPQPRSDAEWVTAYRDQILQMRHVTDDAAELPPAERASIEGPDGPLDLRCYRPGQGVLPGIVAFHGGGFIAGSLDSHDPAFRRLAQATGAAVIAVEYRRAPEHPFPAAVEDCYATAAHVAAHPGLFGIDPQRLVVLGDSAGGGLAAAVALMARDRGGPALAGQICLYPNTDLRTGRDYPSMAEFDGTVVKLGELHRSLPLYLGGADPAHPYASPVLAPLHGVAPALVVTCECDPLRDEGEAYAQALAKAGVSVRHVRMEATIHGLLQMTGAIPDAAAMLDIVAGWLGQRTATAAPVPR